ncbi:MAG: hypothetical protein J0L81_05450 [Caulobacterales bacterium]|jgi:tetratricopeptide (TPR) repeat protein|nr:hypothetical protein [Caulobacterales bacterium]
MTNFNTPAYPNDVHALMAIARAGGKDAVRAARRAAAATERAAPELAQEALAIAIRLEPLDPSPRLALARLHAEAGNLADARVEAAAVLAEAVDQAARARAAFILAEIARVEGASAQAREHYETVLAIEDGLLAADRGNPTAARWYARARGRIAELDMNAGERNRAQTGAEGALALLRATAAAIGEPPVLAADIADAEMRLAALELDSNQPASARRRLGEAIGRYEALVVTEKDEPHWRAVLSDAWALAAEADYARGASDAARQAMQKALQTRLVLAARYPNEDWALAGTWRVHAALHAALGDNAIATQSFAQARAIAERLASHNAQAEAPARFLLHALLDQADHALRTQELNVAREAADCARMLAETFAHDRASAWLGDAGACWDRLGEIARAANAGAATLDAFQRAVEFRRLAREHAPEDARLVRALAAALVKLGDASLAAEAYASARAALHESVTLRFKLLETAPDHTRAAHALAAALERFGLAAQALGDVSGARAAWEDELALAERIFHDDNSIDALRFLAIVHAHLAQLGGVDSELHRRAALERFDTLASAGALTEREAALRKKLWGA